MTIKIYTIPTCPYCHQTKDFLAKQKIEYEEIDVSKDQKAAEEMIKLSGQSGVPVIKIDDKVIIGFDRSEVEKSLQENQ